jgi:hypothetical protein
VLGNLLPAAQGVVPLLNRKLLVRLQNSIVKCQGRIRLANLQEFEKEATECQQRRGRSQQDMRSTFP